ncbi:MAG: energy transducer TonB [Rhodothermales bacterium]
MSVKKTPRANLRARYTLYIEIGFLLALGVLVVAARLDLRASDTFDVTLIDQPLIEIEDMPNTEIEPTTPPPQRPATLVLVPDDSDLDDPALELDAILDIDEPLTDLGPPPANVEVTEPEDEPEIFVIVEQMPELIGGLGELQKKIRYPEIAKKAGVSGRVFVQFVVDEQGNVKDPVVTRGIGAGCDEEAIRAIMQAKFKPGKQRGKSVPVKMSLPITFKLK